MYGETDRRMEGYLFGNSLPTSLDFDNGSGHTQTLYTECRLVAVTVAVVLADGFDEILYVEQGWCLLPETPKRHFTHRHQHQHQQLMNLYSAIHCPLIAQL